jgi:hypothetical protein
LTINSVLKKWLSKQNGCRKSTCKQIIEETNEEIKAHTIPLKAKEATIYGVNLFPKAKAPLNLKSTLAI